MSVQLLQTKLRPPLAHPVRIARPQLVARLNADLLANGRFSRRLTLISAPAGYGKTTLALDWLADAGLPAAWLSLDEQDNDPLRLLNYLVAAAEQAQPGAGSAATRLLENPQPVPTPAVLTALINQLNDLDQPLLLVLDDYHNLHIPPAHALLNFLLEHQPDCLHVLLLSREDPPLGLHRLRARRQLLELRQEDLRFSAQEASQLLQAILGTTLLAAEVDALTRRTEGWASGLQLAALSLHGQSDPHAFIQTFTGSHRYVLDYLFEEVYQSQSADLRAFLLQTALLDRFSAGLCQAVTGRVDAQKVLERLEKANLFIVPLDAERTWYRYHRLFADLLRHQLQREDEPGARELHLRASQWFWAHNLPEEAIQHALAAENWGQAAGWIGASVDAYLKRGEAVTLAGWFERLPAPVFIGQPLLRISHAWALLLAGQLPAAEKQLAAAENEAPPRSTLLGEVYAALAYAAQAQGDGRRLVACSEQALALLPEASHTARGLVSMNLGIAYWHMGRMDAAEAALQAAIPATQQAGNTYGEVTAQTFLARTWAVRGQLRRAAVELEAIHARTRRVFALPLAAMDLTTLYYEWNQLEQARGYLADSLQASRTSGNLEFTLSALMLQARLQQAGGDAQSARQTLAEMHALVQAGGLPERARSRLAGLEVQLALARDDLPAAQQLRAGLEAHTEHHPFYRFLGLTPARLHIAAGDLAAARDLLDAAIATARREGWGYGLVAALVLRASAVEEAPAALEFLAEALDLAQPEGYLRTFLEAGAGLVPHLQAAARRGLHPAYVGQILSGFARVPAARAPNGGLVEPLSERELEVLRLVAAGLSNRQIAAQLVVSLNTVKSHVHNVCAKLDAQNRTQAAARARELGLL